MSERKDRGADKLLEPNVAAYSGLEATWVSEGGDGKQQSRRQQFRVAVPTAASIVRPVANALVGVSESAQATLVGVGAICLVAIWADPGVEARMALVAITALCGFACYTARKERPRDGPEEEAAVGRRAAEGQRSPRRTAGSYGG